MEVEFMMIGKDCEKYDYAPLTPLEFHDLTTFERF